MKSKLALSALLAGTSFAAAQEYQSATARMASGGVNQVGHCAPCDNNVRMLNGACDNGYAGNCGYDGRFYGSIEYLLWKLGDNFSSSGGSFVPGIQTPMPYGLATINNDTFGVAFFNPRILSSSSPDDLDYNGVRFTLGTNFNREWGGELSYFQLERREAGYLGVASQQQLDFTDGVDIFNPFVDVAVQGVGSRRMFGLEANVKHHACTIGQVRISQLVGARYINLDQEQSLTQLLQFTDAPGEAFLVGANQTLLSGDYAAGNQFYGFTVGARLEADFGRFFSNLTGKFSGGAMRQELSVNEFATTSSTLSDIPGTLFPSFSSTENRTRLAFALEGNWTAGFNITDNISVFAGYNILILSKAARPIDNTVPTGGSGGVTLGEPQLITTTPNRFTEQRFVAHGLNVGLEIKF